MAPATHMTITQALLLGSLGIVIGAIGFMILRHFFNPNARDVRRRTRSYRPVVSRKDGPSIKLAVDFDVNKDKKR